MSSATHTDTTTFWIQPGASDGSGGTGAFIQVKECNSLSAPENVADDVEVTHLESPNRTKEFIAGFMDTGEGSFSGNYIPSDPGQLQLIDAEGTGLKSGFKIILPETLGQITWSGYVKSFNPVIETGAQLTFNCSVKASGVITLPS